VVQAPTPEKERDEFSPEFSPDLVLLKAAQPEDTMKIFGAGNCVGCERRVWNESLTGQSSERGHRR
jgi:hypothetical protein